MQNSAEIFNIALGLSFPWQVTSVSFEKVNTEQELHIYLSFIKGSKFIGEDKNEYTAHDTVERKWQHLNFFQHKCYLHAKVPRIRQEDGRVITQPVPWARPESGFTLLFEAYSMLLIESEMPVSKASSIMGVYSQRIWNIFKFWVSKAHQADSIENLTQLGFDETSSKKGHNYITTAVDLKQRRVLFATVGKGADCIEKSVDYLKEKNVKVELINQICIDMSPAFISGCTKYLPQAQITFDKFHVVKEVNKAWMSLEG